MKQRTRAGLDFYRQVIELIDFRSFSNLWFWVAVAVMWSMASHWVLGVPFDMIVRARRQGGEVAEDVAALVAINTRRMVYILRVAGLWLVGGVAAVLSGLALLGFWYGIELAQAVLCLALPMTLVGALSARTTRRLQDGAAGGVPLFRTLSRHRMAVQGIGMVSIFVTAMWGMWQNMQVGVLGN